MGGYHFLINLLPALPAVLGDKLAIPLSEISRIARRYINPSDEPLLRAQLSVIDAANWESIDQGRVFFIEGGYLTRDEMVSGQNLPEFIRVFKQEKEQGIRRPYIYDRLWDLCYRYLMAKAEEEGCRYLIDYTSWEIELRNRLITLRNRSGEKGVADWSIMPGLRAFDFTALVSQLESFKNPLDAERFLDNERLKRIFHCHGYDPFSLDAVLAFLSSAFIYERWEKLQIPCDLQKFLYGGG